MNEFVKLWLFDIFVVAAITIIAGGIVGLLAGFENVNWPVVFIAAVFARIVSIFAARTNGTENENA